MFLRTSALLFLLAALAAGCDPPAPAPPAEPDRLAAFATVYPMADVLRQVGGERVAVDWFAESGQDWSLAEAPPATIKLVTHAKLIVTGGFAEPWADNRFDQQYRALHVVRPEHSEAAREAARLAGWPEGAVQRAWWLDPQVAGATARTIRDRLVEMDAGHEADYRRNADAALDALDALDAEYAAALAPLRGKKFISPRPLWAALAKRYGLEEVVVDADVYRLGDSELREIKAAARDGHAAALALTADLPPAVLRQIRDRTGLRVMPLDPLGSSAPAGRNTYSRIMRYNLEQLVKGLGE